MIDKNGYLAEGISKQHIEGMSCFLLAACSGEERDGLREELLSKKNQELMILEILSLTKLQKTL